MLLVMASMVDLSGGLIRNGHELQDASETLWVLKIPQMDLSICGSILKHLDCLLLQSHLYANSYMGTQQPAVMIR